MQETNDQSCMLQTETHQTQRLFTNVEYYVWLASVTFGHVAWPKAN